MTENGLLRNGVKEKRNRENYSLQQSTDSNTHGNRVAVPAKFSLLLLFHLLSGIEKTSQLKHIFI